MICVQGIFYISFGIWQGRGEEKSGRGRLWALSRSTTLVPLSLPTTTSPLPAFLPGPFSFPVSCAHHSILPGMLFVCCNIIIASTWDTWSKQLRLIVYLHGVRCTLVSSILIQIDKIMAKHGHFLYLCSKGDVLGFDKQAKHIRPGDEPFFYFGGQRLWLAMVKKWTILDQKWPNMAGFSTLHSGPIGSKMVNLTFIDHFGSFRAHLGPLNHFKQKLIFFWD